MLQVVSSGEALQSLLCVRHMQQIDGNVCRTMRIGMSSVTLKMVSSAFVDG